ncbi:hypothetical protein [Domibacillus robiginosus]|uniref:hypothetical protein n=1 Tax=Domibacillus robiginosus TaxID=1071054 RepID=UPI000A59DE3B|nr:hypothetical protein [Domibacillus robiginosus]
MQLKPISIEEAVQHTEGYQKRIIELEHYKNLYKTRNRIKTENPELLGYFGIKFIKRLGDEGIILKKEVNGRLLYSLYSLAKYQLSYEELKKNFYTVPEALKEFGYDKQTNYLYQHVHEEKFLKLHNDGYLKTILLDHKIQYSNVFILKNEIQRFINEHISWVDAANEAGVTLATFQQEWMKKYTKDIIKFSKSYSEFRYINKKDWKSFLLEKTKAHYITKEQTAKILGITASSLDKAAKAYNIIPLTENNSPLTYFTKEDVELLIAKQNELWKQIRNDYLTAKEVVNLLDITYSGFRQKHYQNRLKTIYVPPLLYVIRDNINFRTGRQKIYLKEDVLLLLKERQREKVIENLIHQSNSNNAFHILKTLLNETNVQFSENSERTKEYWFKYIHRKAAKSTASDKSIKKDARIFFNTTHLLKELTNLKEIYDYTDRELNLAVFNSNVNWSIQLEMYKFLKSIFQSRTKAGLSINYNFNRLKNIYKKTISVSKEKVIYSIDEYIRLLEFSKDIQYHKKRAIEDINSQIKGANHASRDSAWLYILLHLTNAWRHYDITIFPRINLKQTRIDEMEPNKALDWLDNNTLNENEIEAIIAQVRAMSFIHSKTKKKRHFFCSKELKQALVHSLILCELRCRICQPLAETLINFGTETKNHIFKENQKKAFFEELDSDFNFQSRKMNRTLISYIYSVIKKKTHRNPLEVTKHVRSHVSEETTNIYIDIPQEQLDFITDQLFDLGHFGYIYDTLSEMLLPEAPTDRKNRTQYSLIVKKVFGDVYQIEQMAHYLNRLAEEQHIVRCVLEGFSLEKRQELLDLIKLGQQPAKKDGFQCLYQECRFPLRDCEKCPFVIPHFHALSQLGEEFYLMLNEFKTKFNLTSKNGEKIRLANNLYSYLHLISIAVKKFGKESVSPFFENGLESVKQELSLLPSMKEYVTIPNIKQGVQKVDDKKEIRTRTD